MRRVIALMAAVLLVLAIAGPVAADPTVRQLRLTDVYHTTCPGGIVFDQFAYGVPGWDASWAPGDTPWLEMSYTLTLADGRVFTKVSPRGLVGNGKIVGPCTIDGYGWDAGYSITNAYLLIPRT